MFRFGTGRRTVSDDFSFPPLEDPVTIDWHWPVPPYPWPHAAAERSGAQPCRIETRFGATVEGELVRIDPTGGTLVFRTGGEGPSVTLPFARVRRLTLTVPLKPLPRFAGSPPEKLPAAAHERDYRFVDDGKAQPMAGRTAGHVERPEGMFLFEPHDDGQALVRIFVPRSAYQRCEFGSSLEEAASKHWCATREQLLEAIACQQRAPVLPIGRAILQLGLATPQQIERALAEKPADVPLGKFMVQRGEITKHDLQTALAHKMGYPLVDLTRFPIDPQAATKLPLRNALECRALPLMTDGARLIVAVDRPARMDKLRTLYGVAQMQIVPVLASRNHIMNALQDMANDVWADFGARPAFVDTSVDTNL
jgi:hypothetical protein